jgi:YVTN family beta-propeller protein
MLFRFLFAALCLAVTLAPFQVRAEVAVVLNSRDASVTLIDTATGREIRTIEVGKEPHHIFPTPDNKSLIVANAQSDDLILLDPITGEFQRRIKGISDPYHLGFSPDRKWFVVNSLRLDRVDLYHYENGDFKLIKRIPVSRMPSHMAFSADSRFVYVTAQGSDELLAISLETQALVWKIPTGSTPAGIWATPAGLLMIGIMGSDHVEVVDPDKRQIIKKIRTGKGAHALRGAGDGHIVFVSNREVNTISVVDMDKLEKLYDIAVPGGPDCMEITADGKQLWTTSRWIKKVTVVDIEQRKVIAQYPVGRSPHGIYFFSRAPMR